MAVNAYDRASFARYTPLSAQEILMPGQILREQHDKLDEEYAQINDNLQKAAFIAANDPSDSVRDLYQNYSDSLSQARDSLMSQGVNSASRRQALDLRGRFQRDITPLVSAYELKRSDIDNYNKALASDNTYIGVNPNQYSVSDYIGNGLQPMTNQGYSGQLIAKQVGDAAKNISDRIMNDPTYVDLLNTQFGPQYVNILTERGINPEDLDTNPILQNIVMDVLQSSGIANWASPEQMSQAMNYAKQGLYNAVGKTESNTVSNKAFDFALKSALQAQKSSGASGGESTVWTATPGSINTVQDEQYQNYVDRVKNKLEGNNSSGFFGKNTASEIRQIAAGKGGGTKWIEAKEAVDLYNAYNNNPQGFNDAVEVLKQDLISKGLIDATEAQALGTGVTGFTFGAGLALKAGYTTAALGSLLGPALGILVPFSFSGDSRKVDAQNVLDMLNTLQNDNMVDEEIRALREENPNLSDTEIASALEDEYRYRSNIFNTRYRNNSASVNTYEERNAKTQLLNAGNTYSVIRDNKGKVTKVGEKNAALDLETIQKNANYIGHSPYNPELRSPSYDFQVVDGNDSYTISIPAVGLSQSYSLSTMVADAIREPFSREKTIDYNGEKFKIIKGRGNQPRYIVEDSYGNKYTLEQLQELARTGISREYLQASTPRSKAGDSYDDID